MKWNLNMLFAGFGIMVTYDIFAAAHRYLHLVRFHEAFSIGDLSKTANAIDFLSKIGLLCGLLFLVVSLLQTILSQLARKEATHKGEGFADLLNQAAQSMIWTSFLFFTLFAYWIKHRYVDEQHLQRAIVFATAYLILLAVEFMAVPMIWAIDLPQAKYIPISMSVASLSVLLLENCGVFLIDKIC